jgi:Legume lectin domain
VSVAEPQARPCPSGTTFLTEANIDGFSWDADSISIERKERYPSDVSRRCRTWIGSSIVLAAMLGGAGAAQAGSLDYPDFSNADGLHFNGVGDTADDVIRVTNGPGQAGSVFTKQRPVLPDRSFTTHFVISQHDSPGFPGDGMALVIQPGPDDALGEPGGGMGYAGIDHSLIVEFDIFFNLEYENDGNHVAIMKNGDQTNHLASGTPNFSLYGSVVNVWARYLAEKKRLRVYVDDDSSRPKKPLVASRQNLNKILDGSKGRAGFSGGTGEASALQDVRSWKLSSG